MGYIVFEDGGNCPMAYGASEEYFEKYDDAIKHACSIIESNMEHLKKRIDANSIWIFEAEEKILHETHSIPPKDSRVIFYWDNYNIKKSRLG